MVERPDLHHNASQWHVAAPAREGTLAARSIASLPSRWVEPPGIYQLSFDAMTSIVAILPSKSIL
jgi:hypothetical protein